MYSSIATIVPPAAEPIALDQLRRHLRVDAEDEDDLILLYAQSARVMAEQFLGRVLVTQTLRWVSADTPPSTLYPLFPFTPFVLPMWMPFSQLYRRPVELPRAPVQSIVAVNQGLWGATDALVDPSQYQLDTSSEPARLKLLNYADLFTADHLIIDFVAGYGQPAAVPSPICAAILLLTAFLYENRGDAGGEWPEAVSNLLWPFRLYSFAG